MNPDQAQRQQPRMSPENIQLSPEQQAFLEYVIQQSANSSAAVRQNVKPKTPPDYSGSKKKDQISAKEWMFLLEQYLNLANAGSETNAVNFAGTLFVGPAASWWVSFRQSFPNISWAQFKDSFLKEFQDANEARDARDALIKCRQSTQSVLEYAAVFRQIVRKIPTLAAEEQIYFFSLGLKSDTAKREVVFRSPTALDEAIQIAYTAEQLYSSVGSPITPAFQNHDPMEIGAINQNGQRAPLSSAEKEELRRNNGCFYCRRPNAGHQSWNCPSKPQNQRNRSFQRGQ
jgi:hypothetical protein